MSGWVIEQCWGVGTPPGRQNGRHLAVFALRLLLGEELSGSTNAPSIQVLLETVWSQVQGRPRAWKEVGLGILKTPGHPDIIRNPRGVEN